MDNQKPDPESHPPETQNSVESEKDADGNLIAVGVGRRAGGVHGTAKASAARHGYGVHFSAASGSPSSKRSTGTLIGQNPHARGPGSERYSHQTGPSLCHRSKHCDADPQPHPYT